MSSSFDDATKANGSAPSLGTYARELLLPRGVPRVASQRDTARYIRLEMRSDTLYSLLNNNSLVIEDFRVLDQQAQARIRQMLLDTLLL